MLAALSVQIEYGDHNPDRHASGFLTQVIQDYIPPHLYRMQKPKTWEKDLVATVSLVPLLSQSTAELTYVCAYCS